jgi:hypothetical protein
MPSLWKWPGHWTVTRAHKSLSCSSLLHGKICLDGVPFLGFGSATSYIQETIVIVWISASLTPPALPVITEANLGSAQVSHLTVPTVLGFPRTHNQEKWPKSRYMSLSCPLISLHPRTLSHLRR